MPLQSRLFRGDSKLEAAAVSDAAHIVQGARGEHVRKIQQALIDLDGAVIKPDGVYGPATSAAVLAYKQKRAIINRSYQSQADNIVGKMTIAALDQEMLAKEGPIPGSEACVLVRATPDDVGPVPATSVSFALEGARRRRATDDEIMAAALRQSRSTLRGARDKLFDLANALRAGKPLTKTLTHFFNVAAKWLNLDKTNPRAAVPHLDAVTLLMLRNINLKTSTGADVQLRRVTGTFHAQSFGNAPDRGLECGTPFFTVDGPNCRRDVVTHEFFYMIGVNHGGGSLTGPTIRRRITTTAQALDSADNLAQLVAELERLEEEQTHAPVPGSSLPPLIRVRACEKTPREIPPFGRRRKNKASST
jgi:hypothetical protein